VKLLQLQNRLLYFTFRCCKW